MTRIWQDTQFFIFFFSVYRAVDVILRSEIYDFTLSCAFEIKCTKKCRGNSFCFSLLFVLWSFFFFFCYRVSYVWRGRPNRYFICLIAQQRQLWACFFFFFSPVRSFVRSGEKLLVWHSVKKLQTCDCVCVCFLVLLPSIPFFFFFFFFDIFLFKFFNGSKCDRSMAGNSKFFLIFFFGFFYFFFLFIQLNYSSLSVEGYEHHRWRHRSSISHLAAHHLTMAPIGQSDTVTTTVATTTTTTIENRIQGEEQDEQEDEDSEEEEEDSSSLSSGFVGLCSRCPPGFGVARRCTLVQDTVCHSCPSTYYSPSYSKKHACWPCSKCGRKTRPNLNFRASFFFFFFLKNRCEEKGSHICTHTHYNTWYRYIVWWWWIHLFVLFFRWELGRVFTYFKSLFSIRHEYVNICVCIKE